MKKLIPWLLLFPFYSFLVIFLYWAVLSVFPAEIIKPIKWEPQTLAAGETVHVTFDIQWTRDCSYHISRQLYNGSTTLIGYVERYHKKGVDQNFQTSILIPPDVPDGKYDLIDQITPVCNLYDSIISQKIHLPSMPITIDNTPLKIISLKTDKKVYKKGESITVIASLDKRRVCDTTVDTFVVTPDNTIVFKSTRSSIILAANGAQTIKEVFDVKLDPGHYQVRRVLHTTCVNKIYQFDYPPVDFEVVDEN